MQRVLTAVQNHAIALNICKGEYGSVLCREYREREIMLGVLVL